jgi:hypothetical protein
MDGRFMVRLPVHPGAKCLGNSQEQAERRLTQLEQRLKKQPNLNHEYSKFMDEILKLVILLTLSQT